MTARAGIQVCLCGAALAVVALIPIPYLACPKWDVWVVNEAGAPMRGMTVLCSYKNYSAEDESHQEEKITDERGHVSFPERWSSASTARRCKFTLLSAGAGVHAGFGPHAWVFTYGNGLEGSAVSGKYVTDWTGSPEYMESRITAAQTSDLRHAR